MSSEFIKNLDGFLELITDFNLIVGKPETIDLFFANLRMYNTSVGSYSRFSELCFYNGLRYQFLYSRNSLDADHYTTIADSIRTVLKRRNEISSKKLILSTQSRDVIYAFMSAYPLNASPSRKIIRIIAQEERFVFEQFQEEEFDTIIYYNVELR